MPVSAAHTDVWLRRYHPATRPDAVRLVCFPHAGGSASYFFGLSRLLAPRFQVLSVQYPGRQDRRHEPLVDDLEQLADQIHGALPAGHEERLVFLGHSMGAVLAFEVIRRMQHDRGVPPARLFASGRRAPSRLRTETVHRRDDAAVLAELRMLNGTNNTLLDDDEIVRMVLPAVRNDYRAVERFRGDPAATVGCPITAMTGDSDPRVSLDDARAWERHTGGEFELLVFPGGHFYLDQCADRVADAVSARLSARPADRP